jgi:hypothetical protein
MVLVRDRDDDAGLVVRDRGGTTLLLGAPGAQAGEASALSVPLVRAPRSEGELPAAVADLPDSGPVAIDGDDELTKVLLSEEARMGRGLTTILLGAYDDDAAETLLLSGRADVVVLGADGASHG